MVLIEPISGLILERRGAFALVGQQCVNCGGMHVALGADPPPTFVLVGIEDEQGYPVDVVVDYVGNMFQDRKVEAGVQFELVYFSETLAHHLVLPHVVRPHQ